jgi:hypothetical protein
MQGFLQIHNDLAAVAKSDGNHAAHSLVIDICIGFIVDSIATGLNARQKAFSRIQKFKVGHYNP